MKKKTLLVCLILLAMGCLACSRNTVPNKKEQADIKEDNLIPLRVAVQQFYISAPIGYMVEHGLDEQFGLKLELVEYPSGAEQIVDVEKDKYDVATTGAAFLYPLVEDKGVVIGEHIRSTGGNAIYVKKDSPILDVKGFNPTYPEISGDPETVGKSHILMTSNTTLQYLGMKWLESIGVKNSAVYVSYGGFEENYQKFIEGEADAVVLGAPYSYQAQKAGYKKVADTKSLHTDIYEVILATKSAHKENREGLVRFLECLLYTNQILETDFQEKLDASEKWYLSQGEAFSRDVVREECKDKILVTRENYEIRQFGEFEIKYAEYMAAIENIPPLGLPNVEKNIDKTLLQEAFETSEP